MDPKPPLIVLQTPGKAKSRQTLLELEAEATPYCPRTLAATDSSRKTPTRRSGSRALTGTTKTPRLSSSRKPRPTIPLSIAPALPKTVYLIRHGESLGQAAQRNSMDRRKDPRLRDAGLTTTGIQQAMVIPQLLGDSVLDTIQLVVSSPLTRALHTAALAFAERTCPLLVHYDLREVGSRVPENTPRDMKHVLKDLKDQGVPRLSEIDTRTLQPTHWPMDDYSSPTARHKRIRHALLWLAQDRNETVVAIVCHFHVIRGLLQGEDDPVVPRNATPILCHLSPDGTLRRSQGS